MFCCEVLDLFLFVEEVVEVLLLFVDCWGVLVEVSGVLVFVFGLFVLFLQLVMNFVVNVIVYNLFLGGLIVVCMYVLLYVVVFVVENIGDVVFVYCVVILVELFQWGVDCICDEDYGGVGFGFVIVDCIMQVYGGILVFMFCVEGGFIVMVWFLYLYFVVLF